MSEAAAPVPGIHIRGALAVTGLCALAILGGGELLTRWLFATPPERPPSARADNVVILSKDPARLAAPRPGPEVLLVGNSHTYALPGLREGEGMRPDPGATLIDHLAREVEAFRPNRKPASYYRLSEPNLLPFEMLTLVAKLLERGHQPRVVLVGVTWRNLARDSRPRHLVHRAYADARFVADLERRLTAAQASPEILSVVAAEVRQARVEDERDRTRAHADVLDVALTERLAPTIALLGQADDVRALARRELAYLVEDLLVAKKTTGYSYDVIESDLAFNLDCLRALVRVLVASGARVVLYQAPERTDLAPLADPRRQATTIAALAAELAPLGVLVVDARGVVPNEYWGWERNTPDRSHFTEPGHRLLGAFLARAAAPAWEALDR